MIFQFSEKGLDDIFFIMEYHVYWLLKGSYLGIFGDGKCGLFSNQKVDGNMIFTWLLWAFHDISGLGKYGFLCSDSYYDTLNGFEKRTKKFTDDLKIFRDGLKEFLYFEILHGIFWSWSGFVEDQNTLESVLGGLFWESFSLSVKAST